MEENVFTVTPMSQRMTNLKPGETYEGLITIGVPVNSKKEFKLNFSVAPYGVSGEDYNADLITESDRTQIVNWITIEESDMTIKPNERKEVHYKIKVPETAPAGGQYAAIIVTEKPEKEKDEGVTVNNIFEMASLIYADVEGETVHEGEILENNISGFVTGAPIMVGALVNNNGNIHESATITIEAKDFFTGAVIVGSDDVSGHYSELVMPETTRRIEREIREGLPALGIIHVEQKIDYNGKTSVEAKNVIICPIWFLVLIIAVIASLVFVIIRIVRKHRKNKSELIA